MNVFEFSVITSGDLSLPLRGTTTFKCAGLGVLRVPGSQMGSPNPGGLRMGPISSRTHSAVDSAINKGVGSLLGGAGGNTDADYSGGGDVGTASASDLDASGGSDATGLLGRLF